MKSKVLYKLGWLFIIISCLCWLLIAIIPFLPFSTGVKAVSVTASIVLAEVFFWIGALLVGKEVVTKYKSYMNPKNWRMKKEDQ
ncbi:hypothetical protein D0469_01280 [Peribacillus saganii]|uniref:Transporter suffix domain-containing protein n=1 Tax=Peribacillus saganii TaxID=2303992 RepID=A0A372LTH8_9BACI|nr:transporter suffix domain-containing protein [Peribacillus saganii]RFU71499.1 hypothetical protein D0469_01280 [Peribacillus saganii]